MRGRRHAPACYGTRSYSDVRLVSTSHMSRRSWTRPVGVAAVGRNDSRLRGHIPGRRCRRPPLDQSRGGAQPCLMPSNATIEQECATPRRHRTQWHRHRLPAAGRCPSSAYGKARSGNIGKWRMLLVASSASSSMAVEAISRSASPMAR